MQSIFHAPTFLFPYTEYKFPGLASDEKILYVSREAPVMMQLRFAGVALAGVVLAGIGFVVPLLFTQEVGGLSYLISVAGVLFGLIFWLVGSWWLYQLWFRSIFILTNRRLTKFIYTTPWNRYNLSLALDKVVDTGAYTRGYLEAVLRVGTFTARSSAGNREEKYFFIHNVHAAEDLANYVNKLLHAYHKQYDRLETFRPFLPFLKGEARKRFMKNYPEYWS